MSAEHLVRLQKLLARAGLGSRRRCEELIAEGRVEVDGDVVSQMGLKVDPAVAVVHVDGVRVPPPSAHVHLVLNKPRGVVSTMHDPRGRRSLADLVGDRPERLFHVGRLDTDTDGVLLLTNDGEFAHRVAHPSYEVTKTYVAQVRGAVPARVARRLTTGIELDDGHAVADRFKVIERGATRSIVELDLHIGRNRIVRRMLAAEGHPVQRLTRTAFGPVRLGTLRPGAVRDLTGAELGQMLDSVSL